MPEIGSLVVKLQAQTASFSTQLKKAQRDIQDLKGEDSGTAFTKMGHGAGGLRAQLGLLDNTMRGNLPMAMADLVRKFSDSALVMNALPFAATIAGFVAIVEVVERVAGRLGSLRGGLSELAIAQNAFDAATNNTMRSWHDRLLEAEAEVDNLTGNHLGALSKELQVIDDQNLDNLRSSFEQFAKEADDVFKKLEVSKLEFWNPGSKPVEDAMSQFRSQYELLLSEGNKSGAAALLKSQIEQYTALVAEMQSVNANRVSASSWAPDYDAKGKRYDEAMQRLRAAGFGSFSGGTEVAAQDYLRILKDIAATGAEIDSASTFQKQAKQIEAAKQEASDLEKKQNAALDRFVGPQLDQANNPYTQSLPANYINWHAAFEAGAPPEMPLGKLTDLSLPGVPSLNGLIEQAQQMQKQIEQAEKNIQRTTAEMFRSFNSSFIDFVDHGGSAFKMLQSLGEGFVNSMIKGLAEWGEKYIATQALMALAGKSFAEQSAAQAEAANLRKQLSSAKAAASSAMTTVGFPLDLVVGPIVFAAALAFERGGKIPGAGAVPIIGHGGETVVTKALTDRVERAEGRGGSSGAAQLHVHYSPTIHGNSDAGIERMLQEHGHVFQRHIASQVRRMNR